MLPTNRSILWKYWGRVFHQNGDVQIMALNPFKRIFWKKKAEYFNIFADILKKCKPHHMGLDTRKPVFGVSEQQRRRPA